MRRCVLSLIAVLFMTPAAFAQTAPAKSAASGVWRDVTFAPLNSEQGVTGAIGAGASISFSAEPGTARSGQSLSSGTQPERRGFTLLLNLGFGIQRDVTFGESATGLAGLNLGLGGFVTNNLAVMARFSGTNVGYDHFDQVSGVLGGTVQYWASDRFHVEGGAGMGYWNDGGDSEAGFGLILGAGVTVFHQGKHYLLVGAEYAPAFTDWGTIHNFGITFGYQFHR